VQHSCEHDEGLPEFIQDAEFLDIMSEFQQDFAPSAKNKEASQRFLSFQTSFASSRLLLLYNALQIEAIIESELSASILNSVFRFQFPE
jgi:uncharacterized protein YfdQ (DUF2303 family)